ncbi:MAG: metal ABC transporter permease [Oligoflexia bacterium]|nr:metal ABC transporter permease [Oligoflexia bacterium]
MSDATWIIATGALAGISCALVGTFLVLRRLSMLGDAISHSVLAGLVSGFLLTGSRSLPIMFIGAIAVGILTAFITNLLHERGKLQQDASIGITFTWLFALGVILISAFAGQVDLDQDCVLFGEIAFTPLDTVMFGNTDIGPRAFWTLLLVLSVNLLTIGAGYRQLKVCSFDPTLARSLGVKVTFWHYVLMTLVSLTTVAAFEAVGSILVVALLVVPANAAFLLTHRLGNMLAIASLIAVIASFSGYHLAVHFDASISAGMALSAGLLLALSLFVPRGLRS